MRHSYVFLKIYSFSIFVGSIVTVRLLLPYIGKGTILVPCNRGESHKTHYDNNWKRSGNKISTFHVYVFRVEGMITLQQQHHQNYAVDNLENLLLIYL